MALFFLIRFLMPNQSVCMVSWWPLSNVLNLGRGSNNIHPHFHALCACCLCDLPTSTEHCGLFISKVVFNPHPDLTQVRHQFPTDDALVEAKLLTEAELGRCVKNYCFHESVQQHLGLNVRCECNQYENKPFHRLQMEGEVENVCILIAFTPDT